MEYVKDQLPVYKSIKYVRGFKIGKIINEGDIYILEPSNIILNKAPIVNKEWIDKHNPQVGGYFVLYKDGYTSYSPATAFEEGNIKADSPNSFSSRLQILAIDGEPPALEITHNGDIYWNGKLIEGDNSFREAVMSIANMLDNK